MRTKTTKEIEQMAFEKLSSWSIIIGASKVLYKRYETEIYATLFFVTIAINIWNKLG